MLRLARSLPAAPPAQPLSAAAYFPPLPQALGPVLKRAQLQVPLLPLALLGMSVRELRPAGRGPAPAGRVPPLGWRCRLVELRRAARKQERVRSGRPAVAPPSCREHAALGGHWPFAA
jgi:hypothetical protein